jgi:t-SNARE complex subunit (syntaxin)
VQQALTQRFEQTRAIERQMHEIAQTNRSIATELTAQMEQAERLYTDAVIATDFIHRGNVQLKKTVAVKKSSGWFLFVVLLAAGTALLVMDALYPG